jgi:hypothetical protein
VQRLRQRPRPVRPALYSAGHLLVGKGMKPI